MGKLDFKSSTGAASKLLLILAIVLLLAIVGVFSFLRVARPGGSEKKKAEQPIEEQGPPEPVYDLTVGDVRFLLESSEDLGSVLESTRSYQKDIITTEKFIKVTVGVQNKGKVSTAASKWDIGNIVDSEGRQFVSINNQIYYYLPQPNPCGAALKPEFDPIPCTKIYEVSKASTGLKVGVKNKADKAAKRQQYFLDLNFE